MTDTTNIQQPTKTQGSTSNDQQPTVVAQPVPPMQNSENADNITSLRVNSHGFKTILLIVLGVVILFLAIAYMVLLTFPRKSVPVVELPKETPKPVVEVPVEIPKSKFATDSGVVQMINDFKTLETEIDSVDFFETKILPPNLDTNIKINK